MKKLLLFLLFPLSVVAQNQTTTQLNINLTEIYSISVDNNVTINLTTQNEFANGSQYQNNTMSIFATHGYRISMQTTNESFVNNVNLHFDNQNIVQLSNVSTEIHQSNDGTLRDIFDLYCIIENTEYFLNKTSNNLTSTIIYTITAL